MALSLVDINISSANFPVEHVEFQSHMQLKGKFDHVSFLGFYKICLPCFKILLSQGHHSLLHKTLITTVFKDEAPGQ